MLGRRTSRVLASSPCTSSTMMGALENVFDEVAQVLRTRPGHARGALPAQQPSRQGAHLIDAGRVGRAQRPLQTARVRTRKQRHQREAQGAQRRAVIHARAHANRAGRAIGNEQRFGLVQEARHACAARPVDGDPPPARAAGSQSVPHSSENRFAPCERGHGSILEPLGVAGRFARRCIGHWQARTEGQCSESVRLRLRPMKAYAPWKYGRAGGLDTCSARTNDSAMRCPACGRPNARALAAMASRRSRSASSRATRHRTSSGVRARTPAPASTTASAFRSSCPGIDPLTSIGLPIAMHSETVIPPLLPTTMSATESTRATSLHEAQRVKHRARRPGKTRHATTQPLVCVHTRPGPVRPGAPATRR